MKKIMMLFSFISLISFSNFSDNELRLDDYVKKIVKTNKNKEKEIVLGFNDEITKNIDEMLENLKITREQKLRLYKFMTSKIISSKKGNILKITFNWIGDFKYQYLEIKEGTYSIYNIDIDESNIIYNEKEDISSYEIEINEPDLLLKHPNFNIILGSNKKISDMSEFSIDRNLLLNTVKYIISLNKKGS